VTLYAGRRLGPYEILSPLGAGGMGEVYRARDTRLERTRSALLSSPLSRQPFGALPTPVTRGQIASSHGRPATDVHSLRYFDR
jgi:serine/threonine protein kinase